MRRSNILLRLLIILMLLIAGYYLIFKPSFEKPPYETTEVRAAIDIGSGASNLKIAKVDTKTDKIIQLLFEKSVPVSYQKHLELSSDETFDQEIMNQGLATMKSFKQITDEHKVKKVVAVATAAFRQAKNAPAFAKEIENQTGIHVWIIDQDLEGILAFEAAMATTSNLPDQSVVWDIGGGSMQLTTKTEAGEYVIQKGVLASIPFRNLLIQEIQGKTKEITSPNPVSEQDMEQALVYIKQQTANSDPYIVKKIENPETHVLAVGSLFNYGIKPLVGSSEVTQEGLEMGVKSRLNKTDTELNKGEFNDIAVSDPLLILGYMKAYNIPEVNVLKVNNADGAMIYPAFWTA